MVFSDNNPTEFLALEMASVSLTMMSRLHTTENSSFVKSPRPLSRKYASRNGFIRRNMAWNSASRSLQSMSRSAYRNLSAWPLASPRFGSCVSTLRARS